jgi:hypothetical protein
MRSPVPFAELQGTKRHSVFVPIALRNPPQRAREHL